jgi:ATP-binding cassette subfamily F protein 3
LAYKGTVIFTSHDRYFLKRMATSIIEVRDGRVLNYLGDYEAYLYSVTKEIEDGERELATRMTKPPAEVLAVKSAIARSQRSEREVRKEMSNIEKSIARLDEQKKLSHASLLSTTDPGEALRIHTELTGITEELTAAEERWCVLSEELMQVE